MTSSPGQRHLLPVLLVTAGLLGPQLACSLRSLDHLANGDGRDADRGNPSQDSASGGGTDDAAVPHPDEAGAADEGGADTGVATGGGSGGVGSGTGGASGSGGTGKTGAGGGGVGTGGAGGAAGRADAGSTAAGGQAQGGSGGGTAPGKSALFVVASLSLNNGDTAIRSRLVDSGFAVTLVTDVSLASDPTVTQDVVLISRTILSTNLGTALRTSNKPVLVSEPNLLADMGMVDSTSSAYGVSGKSSSVVVAATAGALAAGLSGSVVVFSSSQELNYGVPNAQAMQVASVPNNSKQWAEFAYETGAQMPGLNATARRVSFFFAESSPAYASTDGWRLFDAAVAWLAP